MKKIVLILIAIAINFSLLNAQEPEQVYPITKIHKSYEWYKNQAELWWKELQKNKKNENAWYNYFLANRMASLSFDNHGDNNKKYFEETKYLMNTDSIVSQAQLFIPNTFTSEYIIWRNHGTNPEDFSHLQKAYNINPDFFGINLEMVSYYEAQCNTEKRKMYNNKGFKLNEISSGILSYNYNVLITAKPNSAIITFGDNDSFPIWMLQDALGIRQDVTVLNIYLLCITEYRDKIFKKLNIPSLTKEFSDGATSANRNEVFNHIILNKTKDLNIYIGLPAWKQFKDYSHNLYLVGLALEYSTENIDNIALMRNNFENNYALDYISNRFEYDISASIVDRMNINYLPAIFKLYEHYKISGDLNKANKLKVLGLQIAEKNNQDWIDKAESVFK